MVSDPNTRPILFENSNARVRANLQIDIKHRKTPKLPITKNNLSTNFEIAEHFEIQ